MSAKRNRLLELAAMRVETQARLGAIDREIDELFGDRGTTRPGRRLTRRKEVHDGGKSIGAGGSRQSPPATNGASNGRGKYPRDTDELRDKIVALAQDGQRPAAIASQLGLAGREGMMKISNFLYRARKAGTLPKAEASR